MQTNQIDTTLRSEEIGKSSPYAGYSDARLRDTHGYWMSIVRAAKNPAQRERADRGCAAVAAEMRKRAGVAK